MQQCDTCPCWASGNPRRWSQARLILWCECSLDRSLETPHSRFDLELLPYSPKTATKGDFISLHCPSRHSSSVGVGGCNASCQNFLCEKKAIGDLTIQKIVATVCDCRIRESWCGCTGGAQLHFDSICWFWTRRLGSLSRQPGSWQSCGSSCL